MRQQGYVLISLLLILFLIASVSLVLNQEGGMSVQLAADELSAREAEQVALAGLNHVIWRATTADCSGYTDVASTAFGNHSYAATISPSSGSPVHVSATGTLNNGSSATMERFNQVVYQPDKLPQTITTNDGAGMDTYVTNFLFARGNHGGESIVYSGDSIGIETFGLIYFDLASLPSGLVIKNATLSVHVDYASTTGSDPQITIHRMLTDWTEDGASYYTSDGTTNWSYPPPMSTESYGAVTVGSFPWGVYDWDITDLVQQWVGGTVSNQGLAIAAGDGVSSVEVLSKEDTGAAIDPSLTIRYTCECGIYCDTFIPLPVAVAHWKLDETSGTTAADSISDNDGTTYGPTWDSGQINGSAGFNGISDYIEVPHDNDLSFKDTLSISAWINLKVSATGAYSNQTIIGKGTTDFTEEYWFGVWENELEFGILDEGDWYAVNTAGLGLVPGRWYHAAVTFSDQTNEVNIYLDGVKRKTGVISKNLEEDNEDVHIGTSQYLEQWYGNLDDIRLFDYVISPEEVEALTINGGLTPESAETVADAFNDEDRFDGSTGTRSWSGDWQEIGESDGADSGDIRVLEDEDTSFEDRRYAARLRDNDNGGEGIEREADIDDCSTAQLAFEYRRHGLDNNNDYVAVSVSSDGGTNWTELTRLRGPGSDFSYTPIFFDITAHISNQTRIRFRTSPAMGANDRVYIDDVELFLTGCS